MKKSIVIIMFIFLLFGCTIKAEYSSHPKVTTEEGKTEYKWEKIFEEDNITVYRIYQPLGVNLFIVRDIETNETRVIN